jgi:DNA-3-methyladenine glycosylase I
MTKSSSWLCHDDRRVPRCWWCGSDMQYRQYHDREWGLPVKDDRRLFEKLCLEGFQAGLSWITILRRRQNFRQAFADFQIARVAKFDSRDVQRLLANPGIIRHRGKIHATINNAQRAMELQQECGSLAAFVWQFEPARQADFDPRRDRSEESVQLSKALRKRGWKFVGPVTCYSFMQAMGLVNDHHPDCHRFEAVRQRRRLFQRPR